MFASESENQRATKLVRRVWWLLAVLKIFGTRIDISIT